MTPAKNKGGRPQTYPGENLRKSSVRMTHAQQIALRRLGGSKWLREQIEKAIHDQTDK